ncbi:mucin-5B-like [Engystomops pustulosus]|uniref:mucin-5B-like n=1 Tax=Engystomops pustulosus TaxID=76066 RepID=UPI003AFA056B
MKKCAYSDSGTCLTNVFLYLDDGFYEFQITYDNIDFPHVNFNKQRMATAGVHIFWPSSFYFIMQTNKGLYLQVQLMPTMQLYVVLDPSYKEKMCGLCGNFNSIQKDDFRTSSGVLESNAVDFANTWRTNFKCKPITPVHEHPCIYGMEKEKYASYWCNTLLEPEGPFALCHSSVNPTNYHQNCMFDTCSCKRAEDCLCAAISSYVWACAAAGVRLSGWREDVCRIFLYHCPPSFVYSYTVTTCIPTCRSLFEPDLSCSFTFHTVDGCVCPNGTYLNDRGVCVKREDCPCYYKGVPVPTNEPLNVGRLICTCTKGTIQCADQGIKECPPPMVYFDCEKAGEKAKGAECSQTCESTTVQCYSPLCVSGCLCPKELVLSENRTCIKEEECPCVHNGKNYKSGDVTRIHCNQCVCRNKTWVCDRNSEKGICTLYGDGHYITFDNKRYTINGDCEYILVQDYCDIDHLWKGTFKIISENIPCGTTGTSCSKAITVYLGSHKLILADGKFEVLERSSNIEIPYKTRRMGLFLIIETGIGLVLVWDQKTNINIHLNTNYKGMVCGLCGDFDGNGNNDFTTRSQCVVEDVKEFRDSWKVSPNCPEVYITKDPCVVNPYRLAWAQKMCNILLSSVFAPCHSEVDPEKYYEACIKDSCACDMGGDCECYCTAVSVYAQACSEACVCIEWRSPTVCPLSCDFYNPGDECTWHYKACGARCMKTCRNPKGLCMSNLKGLEGCYPKCPKDKPYFNEDEMRCVSQCGCLDKEETYYRLGEEVESCNVCEICNCTSKGIVCYYDSKACNCVYNGQLLKIGEIIELDDGFGGCKKVFCGLNGTIEAPCYTTTETQTGFLQTTVFGTSISLLETSTSLPAISNVSSTTTKSQESKIFTETLFSSLPSQRTEVKSTSTSRKITSSTTKASLTSTTSTVPSTFSTTSSPIISPVSQQTTLLPTKMTTSASLETTRATTLSSAAGSSAVKPLTTTILSSSGLPKPTTPFSTTRVTVQFTEPVRSTNVTAPLNTTGLISTLETQTQTLTTFGLTKLSTGSLQTTRFPVEKTTSTTIGKPTPSVIASKTLPQFSTHTKSGETSSSSTTESLSETTPFTLELSGTSTAGTEISEPLITDNEVIPPTGLVETIKPITTSKPSVFMRSRVPILVNPAVQPLRRHGGFISMAAPGSNEGPQCWLVLLPAKLDPAVQLSSYSFA